MKKNWKASKLLLCKTQNSFKANVDDPTPGNIQPSSAGNWTMRRKPFSSKIFFGYSIGMIRRKPFSSKKNFFGYSIGMILRKPFSSTKKIWTFDRNDSSKTFFIEKKFWILDRNDLSKTFFIENIFWTLNRNDSSKTFFIKNIFWTLDRNDSSKTFFIKKLDRNDLLIMILHQNSKVNTLYPWYGCMRPTYPQKWRELIRIGFVTWGYTVRGRFMYQG